MPLGSFIVFTFANSELMIVEEYVKNAMTTLITNVQKYPFAFFFYSGEIFLSEMTKSVGSKRRIPFKLILAREAPVWMALNLFRELIST